MDLSNIFRISNLAVAVGLILGGIGQFFATGGIQGFIVGAYLILFGLFTGFLEFQIPPHVSRYASFMLSFAGRGAFYIFLASITFGDYWWKYATGAFVGLVGVVYAVLEFIPSIEAPVNMRDFDAGWGTAEHV